MTAPASTNGHRYSTAADARPGMLAIIGLGRVAIVVGAGPDQGQLDRATYVLAGGTIASRTFLFTVPGT